MIADKEDQDKFQSRLLEINREFTEAAARHGHLSQQVRNAKGFIEKANARLATELDTMDRLGHMADKLRKKNGMAPAIVKESDVLGEETAAFTAPAEAVTPEVLPQEVRA